MRGRRHLFGLKVGDFFQLFIELVDKGLLVGVVPLLLGLPLLDELFQAGVVDVCSPACQGRAEERGRRSCPTQGFAERPSERPRTEVRGSGERQDGAARS